MSEITPETTPEVPAEEPVVTEETNPEVTEETTEEAEEETPAGNLHAVSITEEVLNARGELVTQVRETLQYIPDPHVDPVGNPAMSINHPDFVPASQRIYTYNPETGMSESRPMTEEEKANLGAA